MIRDPRTTPPGLEIHFDAREPVWDPTLGIEVDVDRAGTPAHPLVTLGDSLTQGFMSAAIFRTDLSWPATVAYELGLRTQTDFRYPVYEPPGGPGGLPFDLERFARRFESRYGDSLGWTEIVGALLWLRRYMDAIEFYWEDGDGAHAPTSPLPLHNLAVYGWDVLDVLHMTADTVAAELAGTTTDNLLRQGIEHDGARAARVVLEPCRAADGTARTVLAAAEAMSREGAGADRGHGIETLIVMLGANHALGSCVQLEPRWTPDDYLERSRDQRIAAKDRWNVWQPAHFADEWAALVVELRRIRARHVIMATVPSVTIAPITHGTPAKLHFGSRYFSYYTRPWVTDAQFDPDHDRHLTGDEARAIDSAIDAYNATIIDSVAAARGDGLDWYVVDVGGVLERLASRRYIEDPTAQPSWWRGPYPLPAELAALTPVPDSRFFRSGPGGRAEGGLFALDGVHPTTSGYGIIADEVLAIMDRLAGVSFATPQGIARPPGTVWVDFARLLAADTLLTRPPAAITNTLSLLGWLDDATDWVGGLLPF